MKSKYASGWNEFSYSPIIAKCVIGIYLLSAISIWAFAYLYFISIYREEVARELKSALSHIKLAPSGVYVQASTLGSLEALLEFLRTSKIPVSEEFRNGREHLCGIGIKLAY